MVDYRVLSVDTNSFVVQTGLEKPGQVVVTNPGNPPPLDRVCFLRWLSFTKVDDISYRST